MAPTGTDPSQLTPSTDGGRPPSGAGPVSPRRGALWAPLPFRSTRLTEGFLASLQQLNSSTSLPRGVVHLEQERAWLNYDNVASGDGGHEYYGPFFEDGEAYKFLEAAAWEAGRTQDPGLTALVLDYTRRIGAAQDDDGYLNTFVQRGQRGERFERLDMDHEIFNVGALIQSAVAQYRATGHTELLEIACRAADQLDRTFGPDKRTGTCGHPLIEMALVELYRTTAEERYLELARYFVDVRGRDVLHREGSLGAVYLSDRVPVRETSTPEGHAVRAVYLAAGATDVAMETNDTALLEQLQLQWHNMVESKMYLTGGLGSRWDGEAFGDPYELPSDRAYAETCAAIASMQWSWRLLLATGHAEYADLIERQFYNAVLPGVALDGDSYFYVNALQVRADSVADDSRSPAGGRHQWFGCSCCPTNLMRTLASVHAYVSTTSPQGLQIHQFAACQIDAELTAGPVHVEMQTGYPWGGRIALIIEKTPGDPWSLSIRIPSWATGATASVDGKTLPVTPGTYLTVTREWSPGAVVVLELPLTPRLTTGHHRVDATRGAVAIERGPLVYAVEQVDHPGVAVDDLALAPASTPVEVSRDDLLGGVPVVSIAGVQLTAPGDTAGPRRVEVLAVPYFMWANRELGAMRVWLPLIDLDSQP